MTVSVSTDMKAAKLIKEMQKFRREFRVKVGVALRGIKELDLAADQASVVMLGVSSGSLAAITGYIYKAHYQGVFGYSSVREALLKTAGTLQQGEHLVEQVGQRQWSKDLEKMGEQAQKEFVETCKRTTEYFDAETTKALAEYWAKKEAEEAAEAAKAGNGAVLDFPKAKGDEKGADNV